MIIHTCHVIFTFLPALCCFQQLCKVVTHACQLRHIKLDGSHLLFEASYCTWSSGWDADKERKLNQPQF